ncbi:hypothetical protein Gasu2_15110 [Galdieria sulphuraria]|nr:hypothetical protein Gasu2_15110 [Galdieria sulphuraria]
MCHLKAAIHDDSKRQIHLIKITYEYCNLPWQLALWYYLTTVERGYTVSPTQTQQCQKICVTATQTQSQSCIYTQTQAPYMSQCVTSSPTTCYKYETEYQQVCCEQEYEQQNYQQEQVCQQYCQLSYQQSVSYPCQTQIYYPCQEYKLIELQQCCQIPKIMCVQYTEACVVPQVQY